MRKLRLCSCISHGTNDTNSQGYMCSHITTNWGPHRAQTIMGLYIYIYIYIYNIYIYIYIYLLWYTYQAYMLIASTAQYLAIYISGTTANWTDSIYTMCVPFTSTAEVTPCYLPGETCHLWYLKYTPQHIWKVPQMVWQYFIGHFVMDAFIVVSPSGRDDISHQHKNNIQRETTNNNNFTT